MNPRVKVTDWPGAKVEIWPRSKLKPYQKNAKDHPPEQVEQLAALITEFGFTFPVLVREDGEIIAGHGRLMALEKLGHTKVPVIVARNWTDAQVKAYRLADNSVAAGSTWIPDFVRSELADLEKMDYDITAFGLDTIELPPLGPDTNEGPPERAARSKRTLFISVLISDHEKARKLIVAALDRAKIVHNL